jgi:hypothetical protein
MWGARTSGSMCESRGCTRRAARIAAYAEGDIALCGRHFRVHARMDAARLRVAAAYRSRRAYCARCARPFDIDNGHGADLCPQCR